MFETVLSSAALLSVLSYSTYYCLDFDGERNMCHHFYTIIILITFAAMIIINLIFYAVVNGLRKRMIFAVDLDRRLQTNRTTMTSLDNFLTQNQDIIETSNESAYDPVRMPTPRKKLPYNTYVNLIM